MTAREPAERSVNAVAQIFANYQAALHLFEEVVAGDALEGLRDAARATFGPVREACAGVAPGIEELLEDCMGGPDRTAAASTPADLVSAERQRIAVSHSRLIRRRPALIKAAEERATVDADYRHALTTAADRLAELSAGTHTAGALFTLLLERGPRT